MALPNDVVPLTPPDWPAVGEALAGRPGTAALQPGVGHQLHSVARLIRRRFERRARQTGLPITRLQAALLLRVARNGGISQTAAATMLDIEPIALVRMLDRLQEEGLVERRAHPTDRRIRTLWLTPFAWPVVERILAINLAIREEACAGLAPGVRAMLSDALDHMKDNLLVVEEAEGETAALARDAVRV